MATATKQTSRLSNEQLIEVLELVKGADSVELKLTDPRVESALDRGRARDGSARCTDQAGLLLRHARARAQQGGRRRTREAGPGQGQRLRREAAPGRARRAPGGPPEVSQPRRRGGRDAGRVRVLGVVQGEARARRQFETRSSAAKPLRKLFSKEQREFFAANAPEGVELDELSVMGPIFVLKLKWSPREFGRPLVAELWLYPDGSRILELSTKCTTTEPMQVAAEARAFLIKKGVDLSGEQQTKTKTALEFFANELAAAGGPAPSVAARRSRRAVAVLVRRGAGRFRSAAPKRPGRGGSARPRSRCR